MLKRFNKERIFYLLITSLIAIIIFLVSSIQSITLAEKIGINLSTFYHFGVFFMFTFFLSLTLIKIKLDNKTILIILLISLTYAISDEFHQLFVIGRFASLKDTLVDLTGSLLSVLILKMVEELHKN